MKPPIIINDSPRLDRSDDLRVYRSVEPAEKSIEFDDAGDDQLHVFDCEGQVLRIVANRNSRGAHLEAVGEAGRGAEDLVSIFRDFLMRAGEPKPIVESMTLEKLIAAAYDRSSDPYSGRKIR